MANHPRFPGVYKSVSVLVSPFFREEARQKMEGQRKRREESHEGPSRSKKLKNVEELNVEVEVGRAENEIVSTNFTSPLNSRVAVKLSSFSLAGES